MLSGGSGNGVYFAPQHNEKYMRRDYAHIDVISESLKTRESVVDFGSLSFHDESTVNSKNVIQIVTAPYTL
jgi:hypothetical protein